MCMVLQKNRRKCGKMARKDLYCWKYFSRMDGKTVSTPVYQTRVREEKGRLLTPDRNRPDISNRIAYGGVIHAARCDCDGLDFLKENVFESCPVVALMVIPKDTRYWVGENGQICAERMEYLQTYRTPDGGDVGFEFEPFADWYDEMREWLIDNETVY